MALAPVYSKQQLRRAGRLLRDVSIGEQSVSPEEFWEAVMIVEWWRSTHAKPLVRTNAGLRYYARQSGGEVNVRRG